MDETISRNSGSQVYFYLFVFLCSVPSNAQSSNFRFCEDFQSLSFSKGYRNKEITKNNGYYINGESKEGRFNEGFLTTFTKKQVFTANQKDQNMALDYMTQLATRNFLPLVLK